MALTKQPIPLNFARGLDRKTDPYQVALGNFLSLSNSVFGTTGRLTKRFGFDLLSTLPNLNQTTITTLNDNLITTGSNLLTYDSNSDEWLDKGTVQPIQLSVQSMVRSSTSQESPDAAIALNGLACLVYEDSGRGYYSISNSVTGQQVVARQSLPVTSQNVRVFILGRYFIITYLATVAGNPHLQYVAIPQDDPTNAGTPADISSAVASIDAGYDCYSANNTLYVAWGGSGGVVRVSYLDQSLVVAVPTVIAGSIADLLSLTVDMTALRVWVSFWDTTSNNGYATAFDLMLNVALAKTQIITAKELRTLTSISISGVLSCLYEVSTTYTYSPNALTDYVESVTINLAGSAGPTSVVLRSVGLASKPVQAANGTVYLLVVYGDTDQTPSTNNSNESTYLLIDSTGNIFMRLAATNAGGYARNQVLPSITNIDDEYLVPYMLTDFLATVNKGTDLPVGTPTNAIYTQTGINLATFTIDTTSQYSSEIASALHLTGGQIWEFDGVKPVELGFHVYPENIAVEDSVTPGDLTDQKYFYQVTYEWTDNQGNLHRSAPSVPVEHVVTGGPKALDIHIPTLRLTYKTDPNPVRIMVYRWSTVQQVYYQVTDIKNPIINDLTVDSITYTDTLSDAAILGTTVLYTTGGVLENIAPPASTASCLFDNRMWLIDAENQNLLWYSKQIIQNVPVEFTDLLTVYTAPTTGSQGSTGPSRALGAMDDKLIIFKKDAMYYINGSGPDNTGLNSNYSQPTLISSTVGTSNPRSVVLTPNGLMFQSDKGIWLLGRDLTTKYIGAPVEAYNDAVVHSASVIPGTNEVRFVIDQQTTLMYDYFYDQWSTHTNILAISSTLYQSRQTYLNSVGQVLKQSLTSYKDNSVPVLMSLTTSWINIAGVQGLERFYFAQLLGTYYSPFKLNVTLAYDYNESASQGIPVTPDNYSPNWGELAQWGSSPEWGGPGNVFSATLCPERQKTGAFQVTINEIYDPSLGQEPGQGLSLSGLALIVGVKKGYRSQKASRSFG